VSELLPIIPVLLAIAGALATASRTLTKFRARSELSSAIRSNAQDINQLKDQLNIIKNKTQLSTADLDAATAVVRRHVEQLPKAERDVAELALGQPSVSGRVGYISEVAADRS